MRNDAAMQFDASSVQLSATITELIERLRQAAYDEGYEDARSVRATATPRQTRHVMPQLPQ